MEEYTYVDDMQPVGETEEKLIRFKNESSRISTAAGFQLHKWHSNVNKFKLTLRIVEHHHTNMLHGGVGDTMGSIRERFWISNLIVAVKMFICGCNLCNR